MAGEYDASLGRHIERSDVTLKTSGAEITSTNHTAVELGDAATMNLLLDVTAASGTPTLDVTIEGANEDAAPVNWYTLGTFTQQTGIAAERKAFVAARWVRSKSTIAGGTPSVTYSVTGEYTY